MTKHHTGNLFFSVLFLLSALLAAVQPLPASAQEPIAPADPRPVDPKVRFGLEQAYEPDAAPFSPYALTDAAGEVYEGDYDPAETFVSGQWGLPSAGGVLAADDSADIRNWWAGLTSDDVNPVMANNDFGRFYLASIQPISTIRPTQVTQGTLPITSFAPASSDEQSTEISSETTNGAGQVGMESAELLQATLSSLQPESMTVLAPVSAQVPSVDPPEIFYSNQVTYEYIDGTVILAPINGTELCTDDKVVITVTHPDGSQAGYAHDYRIGGPGINCTPPVDLTDRFEPGTNIVSIQLWDMMMPFRSTSSGYQLGAAGGDITPPKIEVIQLYSRNSGSSGLLTVSLLVRIYDVGGGAVASYSAAISDGTVAQPLHPYSHAQHGANVYSATFDNVPNNKTVTITITAADTFGNAAQLQANGYFSDGRFFGSYTYGPLGCRITCGNPIGTVDGQKVESLPLLFVPGPGEADIDLTLTYNSNNIRPGLFGAAISSEFETHLLPLYNEIASVEIVAGDGGRVTFMESSGVFVPISQGSEATLVRLGSDYLYTTHDQIGYRFDTDGRLLGKLDRNGNTVSFGYSGDQLTSISAGGRTVTLAYTGDYVSSVQFGNKTITLSYDGDKLVGIEDANGGDWALEYETRPIGTIIDERGETFAYEANNHYLTRVVTPEGRIKNQQTYDADGRVTSQFSSQKGTLTFSYTQNPDGSNETRITDANGHQETHYYNERGELVQRTNAEGKSEYFTYNANSHYVQRIDFNGNLWQYERDSNGNITILDGPEGLHQEWEYNDFNEPTYFKDGDGFEWRWEYDGNGNVTRIIQPDGSDSEITYDGRGLPTDIYDFVGNHTVNSYDSLTGDLLSVTDGEGSTTSFTYDQYGRRATMTLPLGSSWSYGYDLNNNLTAVDGRLGYHTSFTYDADDLLTEEVDADNRSTTYEYDERGRLVETRNGENEPTFFEYGPMNELEEVTDARNAVTTYEYDELYHVIQVDMEEGVSHTFEYDGLGNVLFATDGEGRVTATTYDDLSRPFAVVQNYIEGGPINADTNVVTQFEYNQRSLVTRLINPLGDDQELEYDNLGRLIRQENEAEEATLYSYDANGNVLRITRPELDYVETTYNGRNQPETLRDGEGFITTFVYNANGNLANINAPDGIVTHYDYNPLDQRTQQTENYQAGMGEDHDLNVTTAYSYSLAGDLLAVVDGEGYEFTFEYDGAHRLIHETSPEGDIHYTYDDVGNLIAQLDPNSHPWLYEYDLLGRLTRTANPEGHYFDYDYDRASNVVGMTDARGYLTTTAYDALNRPILITNPLNYETDFTYDALGNLLALTDGNGHTTHYEYDKVQRLLTRIDAEGFRTEWEYDDNGRQTLRRIPFADSAKTIVDRFGYDGRDLLTSTTNGEGEVTGYAYNSVGLLETKTENDGIQTFYGYDDLRRLNLVTLNYETGSPAVDDLNVSYFYGYDRVGNLVSVLDPLSHETTFDYNGLGSLVFERNPIGSEWHYDYDPAQNLTFRQDANGQQTHYNYYPDNQLQVIDYPDDPNVTYQYDANNNPTRMTDGLGTTTWSYDALNRVIQVRDSLRRIVRYTYDAVNRLSVRYPDSRTVRYAYLDNDWLASATDPTNGVNRYNRDEAGRVILVDHPNRTYSTRSYDRASRLLNIGNYQVGGDVLSSFSFSYDAVGQRTQAVNTYGWRNPPTVVEDYTYDGLRRLIGVSDSEGMIATYGYDRAGNRTEWQTNDDPFGQSPQDEFTAIYEYDAANQLLTADIQRTPNSQSEFVTYTYDANGNRIDRLVDGNGSDEGTAYTYDDENRLVSAYNYLQTGGGNNINWQDETTMAYDGNGRRLVETYDPHAGNGGGLKRMEYTFDGLDPIAEYDLWDGQRRNFYRGDGNELIEMHNFPAGTQGQRYWYHHNGLGAIAGMTKQRGQSTHNYRYDAYGGNIPANGNFTNPHNDYTLTEKSWDDHTGLYYFGARHYDPLAAVWLTQDTYRGKLLEPLSLHRHLYVYDNPINFIDAYGNNPFLIFAAVMVTVAIIDWFSSDNQPANSEPQNQVNDSQDIEVSTPENTQTFNSQNVPGNDGRRTLSEYPQGEKPTTDVALYYRGDGTTISNCTWYAAAAVKEYSGGKIDINSGKYGENGQFTTSLGHAYQWANSARAAIDPNHPEYQKYKQFQPYILGVDDNPKVGDVYVYPQSSSMPKGHVAFVEAVNIVEKDGAKVWEIHLSEENYGGGNFVGATPVEVSNSPDVRRWERTIYFPVANDGSATSSGDFIHFNYDN